MALKERITEDMKAAMRAGAKERLATVRLLLAAIKQREVDERIMLEDGQVLAVIEKMIKQRREAISQFESGGRSDLVAKETAEIGVLQAYLPVQLTPAEIDALIHLALLDGRDQQAHGTEPLFLGGSHRRLHVLGDAFLERHGAVRSP